MSKRNKKKKPRQAAQIPPPGKQPLRGSFSNIDSKPSWRFSVMDMEGPWGWNKCEASELAKIHDFMKSLERMQWNEIFGPRHKFVKVSNICKEAQNRLRKIKQDDTEELFELRPAGKPRIWGIWDQDALKLIWWDPNHEVCPAPLKNT